jgi:glyceraldehyde 3-phosphate dehydrogenase
MRAVANGIAVRAPVPICSIADITVFATWKPSADEVNQILTEEAATDRYAKVLGASRDPLVSSIIGDPRASIVDLELSTVIDGDLVKVLSWYDNEWGYANQMLREALSLGRPLVISLSEHRSCPNEEDV